ncbi:hypothetical protein Avbf_01966 [Armadillidium vulgare]|nr:hypothetical protein Avbf_01966 [Armadillidium vulgare]
MKLLEIRPLHVFLVFIAIFVNNVALTSPQRAAYHMCDTLEKQYSYLCPSYTLFNQKYMVCDHWHSVNCSAAIHYYSLNEEIGKVPDKGKNAEDNVIDDQKTENSRKYHKKNDIKSPSTDAGNTFKNEKDDSHSKQKDSKSSFRSSFKTTTQKPSTSILPPQFREHHDDFQERADDHFQHKNSKPNVRPPLSATQTTPVSILPPQFRQPKQNFQLPRTFNANLVPSTNLQTPKPELQSKDVTKHIVKPSVSSTKSPFHLPDFPPTTPRSNFLSHSGHEIKPFPVNPRGSGKRIKFDQVYDNDLNSRVINGVKFRPLLEKPKNQFIDKRNFTVPPNVFTLTSASPFYDNDDNDNDDNDFDYDVENDLESRSSPKEPIITFLIPPTVESPKDRPFGKLNIPSLTTILVPPPKGPVILESDHQEVRTPLIVSKIFRSFGLVPPQTEITPPRFPFSRPNRQFFIPSPGLQPPLHDNSISEEEEKFANELHAKHKMTMTFPNSTAIRRRPLKINPRCPRCHPAFLKPNQCQPCVIIK